VTRLFPEVPSPEAFERTARNEAELAPGIVAIKGALGLTAPLSRFAGGSLPVYAVGENLVLKVYPPIYCDERDREAGVLGVLHERLPIPTPAVRATGELEGWSYLLMDRLRGALLSEAWPILGDEDRTRLATELGGALRALHSIRDPALDIVRVDWPTFLDQQRETCVERQRNGGLEPRWVEQIAGFLSANPLDEGSTDSLLHTEVMREHLLVERGPGGWHYTGVFDFEPAMVGAPEYEFASVGLFFSCAEPRLTRSVLLAYGYRETELNAALERRLLVYTLLHKYGNLASYLRRFPPPEGATTLEQLASYWWGVADSYISESVQ
jgi:hygromycin-B 7''-O-kinase